MDSIGTHLLSEYWGCDVELLNDQDRVEAGLREAAQVAGATVVAAVFHRFAPHGITGVVVVEESHLSIHTWPETGYAAVDFFTCGECDPARAQAFLADFLKSERSDSIVVRRGDVAGLQVIEAPGAVATRSRSIPPSRLE